MIRNRDKIIILILVMAGIIIDSTFCAPADSREIEETTTIIPTAAGVDSGLNTVVPVISQNSRTTRPPFDLVNNHNGFGLGAAAGFGGLGASAGLGSFHVDTKSDPFLPFGAFAGINLPNSAGRIGAGCTGLNCGVQLGEFVLQLPSIANVFSPNLTRQIQQQQQQQSQSTSFSDAVGTSSTSNNADLQDVDSNGNSTQILRTRNDGTATTGTTSQSSSSNIFRTLLGGLRDFRTTLASFFREPQKSQQKRTNSTITIPLDINSSTAIPPTLDSSSTSTATTKLVENIATTNNSDAPLKVQLVAPTKLEISENELFKNR